MSFVAAENSDVIPASLLRRCRSAHELTERGTQHRLRLRDDPRHPDLRAVAEQVKNT